MIIVVQCAAKKQERVGHLRDSDGRRVLFVANPESAPPSSSHHYARPDDKNDAGQTWRQMLLGYNRDTVANELSLCPAIELYANRAYDRLASLVGAKQSYILSAGWGLIRGDFLTPNYDITFSAAADPFKRRKNTDAYQDLNMLPELNSEPIVFFGGKDYVPLFCELTNAIRARRTIFYNSEIAPDAPNCTLVRFKTKTRTNWHYECLNAFLDGRISGFHPQITAV